MDVQNLVVRVSTVDGVRIRVTEGFAGSLGPEWVDPDAVADEPAADEPAPKRGRGRGKKQD